MSFEVIVQYYISRFNLKPSLIASFFVGTRENKSCILFLVAMMTESRASDSLPNSHRAISSPA